MMSTVLIILSILGAACYAGASSPHQDNVTATGASNSNDSSVGKDTSPHLSPVGTESRSFKYLNATAKDGVSDTNVSSPGNGTSTTGPEGRSLKYLTPGQEFLLSVASFEDTRDSNFQGLPYLSNVLQSGTFGKKQDTSSAYPLRMRDAVRVMTAEEKSDEELATKPPGLLAKLAGDPANLLLAAVIPLSILLAAVVPFLVNQFMNRGPRPSVTTTAGGRPLEEQGRFLEEFVLPVVEAIARLDTEFDKDRTSQQKTGIFRSILRLISTIVGDNWMSKFSSTPVDRLRYSKP